MGLNFSKKRITELRDQGEFFLGVVDHRTMVELIEWIAHGVSHEKRDFTILISSPGGSPSWVIHFASLLRTIPTDVRLHGVALGECGSATLALLQCCHTRKAVRCTAFYPHHVQCTLEVNCQKPMAEIIAYVKREIAKARMLEAELVELQSRRMGITPEDWMKIASHGEKVNGITYLTDDALRLNMIDEVIEHYLLVT